MGIEWQDWADGFDRELRAASRPESTRKLRLYHLRRFAGEHPGRAPNTITRDDLIEWLGAHDWSAETRRSHRATLRLFYRWARDTGRITVDPAATLPPIKPPRSLPRPAPDSALRHAVLAADERTQLMLELLAATGARRGECAAVHTRDVEADLVGWSLRIVGKGGHIRLVPLPDALAAQLRRRPPGYLFPGKIDGHLSPRRVGELVSAALPDHWTAHTLRHRYATIAYTASHDLRAVQELLGHAKVETTAIYTQVSAPALRVVAAAAWTAA